MSASPGAALKEPESFFAFAFGLLRWPFWNAAERRPRALVRIVLQFVLLALATLPLSVGILGGEHPWFRGLGFRVLGLEDGREASMEVAFSDAAYFSLLLIAITLSVAVACRVLDRRAFASLGVRGGPGWGPDFAFGTVLGIVLIGVVALLELACGWAAYQPAGKLPTGDVPPPGFVPVTVFVFFAVAVYEELVSRGYHLTNLAEGLRGLSAWALRGRSPDAQARAATIAAAVLSSLVFGLLHAGNPNASLLSTALISLAGLWLAAAYLLTGELALPMGIHLGWNLMQNVLGMPVSGNDRFAYGAVLTREVQGPEWLTGGAFGPEAGLTGWAAILVGFLLVVAWVRLRRGEVRVQPLGTTSYQAPPAQQSGTNVGSTYAS